MEDRKYKVIDGPAVVLGFSECRPEDETGLDKINALEARQAAIRQRRDQPLVTHNPGLKGGQSSDEARTEWAELGEEYDDNEELIEGAG